MEGYLYDNLATYFEFICQEDGSVLELSYIGQYLVIEDNTNNRRWFF